VKCAVLPLVNKDGLPEKAREILDVLKLDTVCRFDAKDSIGKRYRRHDAVGTPYAITVDHQTLDDGTVTIRERDTMQQQRIATDAVSAVVTEKTTMKNLLKAL
jgi:glycyl-tRNA synthetase